jgi:hypothetical protein
MDWMMQLACIGAGIVLAGARAASAWRNRQGVRCAECGEPADPESDVFCYRGLVFHPNCVGLKN